MNDVLFLRLLPQLFKHCLDSTPNLHKHLQTLPARANHPFQQSSFCLRAESIRWNLQRVLWSVSHTEIYCRRKGRSSGKLLRPEASPDKTWITKQLILRRTGKKGSVFFILSAFVGCPWQQYSCLPLSLPCVKRKQFLTSQRRCQIYGCMLTNTR